MAANQHFTRFTASRLAGAIPQKSTANVRKLHDHTIDLQSEAVLIRITRKRMQTPNADSHELTAVRDTPKPENTIAQHQGFTMFCLQRPSPAMFHSNFLVLTIVGLLQVAVHAQDPTKLPANDPMYALLGEYVGPISIAENKYEPLAIQIRPLADNRFEALQYSGGLPGQESHKPGSIKLIGQRSGDFVVLSGGPYAVLADQRQCIVVNRQGDRIGTLNRVTRTSPTLGAQPPAGAVVLFDGSNTDQFTVAEMTKDGLLKEGADVKPMFQDFDMHVEYRLPYMPNKIGQARGNSGCYLQSRYEVQVLDSFGEPTTFNGCGSLYRFKTPDLNMCFPPLQWQAYDIHFTAPRWAADGTKVRNARITVWHNGVKIHDDVELPNKTGAGKQEEPLLLPTRFQNHSDPVRFRNIWVVDRGLTSATAFPVFPKATPEPKQKPKKDKPQPEKKDSQDGDKTEAPKAQQK